MNDFKEEQKNILEKICHNTMKLIPNVWNKIMVTFNYENRNGNIIFKFENIDGINSVAINDEEKELIANKIKDLFLDLFYKYVRSSSSNDKVQRCNKIYFEFTSDGDYDIKYEFIPTSEVEDFKLKEKVEEEKVDSNFPEFDIEGLDTSILNEEDEIFSSEESTEDILVENSSEEMNEENILTEENLFPTEEFDVDDDTFEIEEDEIGIESDYEEEVEIDLSKMNIDDQIRIVSEELQKEESTEDILKENSPVEMIEEIVTEKKEEELEERPTEEIDFNDVVLPDLNEESSDIKTLKEKISEELDNCITYYQLLELISNKMIPTKIMYKEKIYVWDGITYNEDKKFSIFNSKLLDAIKIDPTLGEKELVNHHNIKILEWNKNE